MRLAQLAQVVAAVGHDPAEQQPVEREPQEVARRDHGRVAAGMDGAVHLAGGGDQQTGRQERVTGSAAAAVGPMRQQGGHEERGTDHSLDGNEHGSQAGRQGHRRELDQLDQGGLGRQLGQPVLRQRRQGDGHAHERRRRDEHHGGPGARRRAVEAQCAREDEEHGGGPARDDARHQRQLARIVERGAEGGLSAR